MVNLSAWLDAALCRASMRGAASAHLSPLVTQRVQTTQGELRVFDSDAMQAAHPAALRPCVLLAPDGPNVIEHYEAVIALLVPHYRVLCFDMLGFGFSVPGRVYDHTLQRGAQAILELMNQLHVPRATLALSCANGFYAIRLAQMAPQRVERLVLSQTPSLEAMHRWTDRVVPKVLRVALLGQLLSRVFRLKMATVWYRIALPKASDAEPFQRVSRHALRCGGCFSLAGVVQGLLREPAQAARLQGIPCTVLWGTQDRSHQHTQSNAILQDVPHANVQVLADCGHFPDLENPQRFVQAILSNPLISLEKP